MKLEEARRRVAERTAALVGLPADTHPGTRADASGRDLSLLLVGCDVDVVEIVAGLEVAAHNLLEMAAMTDQPDRALHGGLIQIFLLGYLVGTDE